MKREDTTDTTETKDSSLPAVLESWAISRQGTHIDALQANIGAGGLSLFDLQRVKVPAGGATIWEVPSIDGSPSGTSALEGVIVYYRDTRSYWRDPDPTGGPPDCQSDDGTVGHGDPGGQCVVCPMARFGTRVKPDGTGGRGQACVQRRVLAILCRDEILPIIVMAPPSSLRGLRQFFLGLASKGMRFDSVVVRLALKQMKNADGQPYAEIQPVVVSRLSPADLAQIQSYAKTVDAAFHSLRFSDESIGEQIS